MSDGNEKEFRPGRLVKHFERPISERTPFAEDVRTILNQMSRMLDIYNKIINVGTHTDVACKGTLSVKETMEKL